MSKQLLAIICLNFKISLDIYDCRGRYARWIGRRIWMKWLTVLFTSEPEAVSSSVGLSDSTAQLLLIVLFGKNLEAR